MAQVIWNIEKSLTDAQITAMYAIAEKVKVSIMLWQNTPSPARDAFRWSVRGNIFRIWKYKRELEALLR